MDETKRPVRWIETVCAWVVHLLTASGAVFGMLALVAAARGEFIASFAWMAVTIAVDGIDGALARRLRVREVLPSVDGALLDNVVDYFTWTIVPTFLLCVSWIAGPVGRWPAAAAILISSAYQFARVDAKTEDHAFSGFPSYWNITIFYMYMLRTPSWFNVTIILVFAAASFLPLRCLYPSRTPHWRAFNVGFGLFWALCLTVALVRYPYRHLWPIGLSFIYVAYYAVFSAWLTLRGGRGAGKQAAS